MLLSYLFARQNVLKDQTALKLVVVMKISVSIQVLYPASGGWLMSLNSRAGNEPFRSFHNHEPATPIICFQPGEGLR